MKKTLALILAIVMMAALAVPAFAEVQMEETKPLGNNDCTVSYGVSQTYTISLPIAIDFGTNTTAAQTASLVVDALVINGNQKLVITMDSIHDTDPVGGWFMADEEGDSDDVEYTVKLTAKEGDNVTATVSDTTPVANGTAQAPTVVMTVASNAEGEGGSIDLKFETEGTSQAGTYEDTVTFGVSIVDVNS